MNRQEKRRALKGLRQMARQWPHPWICAGGFPLSLIIPQIETKDVDIFTPDPIPLANITSVELEESIISNGDILAVGLFQFIPAQMLKGHTLAETVLGSFDYGIIQCGWNGGFLVTDLWLKHAGQGLIDLDPKEDPWARSWRTQARARKIHAKLGWKIGPLLTEFLQKRAEEDFKLSPDKPGGEDQLLIDYSRARTTIQYPLRELRHHVCHSEGPGHLLEVAYGETDLRHQ